MGSPLLRPLLWIAGALVVVIVAAVIAVPMLFPPERVRALVSRQLDGVLARDFRYAGAEVGLWPPVRLSVRQPGLAEPGGFERGTAIEARAIHLDLDVLALLSRRVVVRRLVLDRPRVHVLVREDGSTNLDSIVKPPPPGRPAARPMDLKIRELRVVDGLTLVDDRKARRRIALGIGSTVALSAEAEGTRFATSGRTEISDLRTGPLSSARRADLDSSLAKLVWRIEHDGKLDTRQKRLALGRLALAMGHTEIAASGIVDEPGLAARLDLRARGSAIDVGAVLDYLAVADAKALRGVSGSGRLDFDLKIAGRLGAAAPPGVTGTLTVANGAFRYAGAPASVEALAFTARFAPDTLAIGDLRARVGDQPVRAALFATRFADPWMRFAVQGDVDLAAVAPLVAPRDTKLGGRVAMDVRGSGRAKDLGGIALDGSATLRGVSVQSPALPNKVEDVNGALQFSQSRAGVTGLTGKAAKSSFRFDGSVTRPLALLAPPSYLPADGARAPVAPARVDFNLTSPHLDLAELLPQAKGAPVMPNAVGGGRIAIRRLLNAKLDVEDVQARVALEPGVLGVPEYALKGYGGHVSGSARFDLRDPASPAFVVKTRVDSLQANALLSSWTGAKDLLHGELTSSFDLSGAGTEPADLRRTLTAVGQALVADGALGPGPTLERIGRFVRIPRLQHLRFKDAKVPFRVERGRVLMNDVVLDGPNGEWRLSGSVGFEGEIDYAVSATLPPDVVAALGANAAVAAGALADENGRLLLDLRVRGPWRSPQISWDTGAMRDRLAGRVSKAIEEQKAKIEAEVRDAAQARARAAEDSARAVIERAKKAAADSLRRRAGDVFKGFFGGRKDTTSP